jgi:UDP-N-acetylmuramate dehydrogenase
MTSLHLQNIQTNRPLNALSTFGIGGPAQYYIEVHTIDALKEALQFAKHENLAFFILGKGSNCLFDDRGFEGLVIHNKIDFFENNSPGLFHVGAGYSFSLLGVQTARQNWTGLEFASGIPASVGGAVYMNAGANGGETKDCLESVDFIDPAGHFLTLKKEELQFDYRLSSFQRMEGAIVGATFQLSPSNTARAKQLEIVKYRMQTQPYGDKSAGCVFRNPLQKYAGALIEQSGLKGFHIGGAQISSKHANFIVNDGAATSADVQNLILHIQNIIQKELDIKLESEIRVIPFTKGGR